MIRYHLLLICSTFMVLVVVRPPYAIAFATGWGPLLQPSISTTIPTITSKQSQTSNNKIVLESLYKTASHTQQQQNEQETATMTHNSNNDNNNNNKVKTSDILSLESIRSTLIRQEETIIFALIERAQFRQNLIVYEKGGFGNLGCPPGSKEPPPHVSLDTSTTRNDQLSFMEFMLVGTETLHCSARRYLSPEEHPFFPERLPSGPHENLILLQYPDNLLSNDGNACNVNFNKRLLQQYIANIVPQICKDGDDEQHGSTTLCDIAVLQAISRRVHYGKFVAESKYRSDPNEYKRLVSNNDADGVMRLLTNTIVEDKVLRRAKLKAATYGSEPLLIDLPPIEGSDTISTLVAAAAASAVVAALSALDTTSSNNMGLQQHTTTRENKVDPHGIESIYKNIIIPMTKDIEVAYLFRRCGKEPPIEYQE